MLKIPAKKICVIRLSALGDTVHTLGLINGLRTGYPDAHITWILQPLPYDMVKNNKTVDRYVIFDRKKGIHAWLKLAKDLKGETFDLVLMLQVSMKASLISMFVKGGVKLGFDYNRSREMHWLFTNRKIDSHEPQHVQAQFFEFLDYLGIEDYPQEWDFGFTEEELVWRDSFFNNMGRPAAAFVIASSNPKKDWPPGAYARVMDEVDKKLNLQPLILGGPSSQERVMAEEVQKLCKSDPVLALERPIRHTLLQLSGSKIVVSPDTGPLHMAVAMNVPTVSLYGYSNPRRCGPYARFHDLLIDKYNDPGEENSRITRVTKEGRIESITPEEVFEKIVLGIEKYGQKTAKYF